MAELYIRIYEELTLTVFRSLCMASQDLLTQLKLQIERHATNND